MLLTRDISVDIRHFRPLSSGASGAGSVARGRNYNYRFPRRTECPRVFGADAASLSTGTGLSARGCDWLLGWQVENRTVDILGFLEYLEN